MVTFACKTIKQEQELFVEDMNQFAAAAEARFQSEATLAQREFDALVSLMLPDKAKAMMRITELHRDACAAGRSVNEEKLAYQQKAWDQFKHVEIWYQNSVR